MHLAMSVWIVSLPQSASLCSQNTSGSDVRGEAADTKVQRVFEANTTELSREYTEYLKCIFEATARCRLTTLQKKNELYCPCRRSPSVHLRQVGPLDARPSLLHFRIFSIFLESVPSSYFRLEILLLLVLSFSFSSILIKSHCTHRF